AITHAVQVLLNGGLLAVKSTGGIQLCALALSELEPREFKLKRNPVDKLRKLKARGDKPFAVMMRDVAAISRICEVNVTEQATLESLAAPIVLLEKKNPKDFIRISDNHLLGVMLPSQPIYHILMQELALHGIDMCIVTSANPPGRPILSDSEQFILDMSGYFDAYLDHNREIIHPIEDSVVSVFQDQQVVLRFGRGYAPSFILDEDPTQTSGIAFGADLKANFALRLTKGFVLGPFISDLHTREHELAFEKSLDHFLGIYKLDPSNIYCDLHPQYVSRYLAQDYIKKNSSRLKKLQPVQHHYAHAASQFVTCPNEASLALVCDGLGFGYGNEIWGCELFSISKEKQLLRIASLSPYNLLGGDRASRDPGLCLLSLVRSIDLDEKIKKDLFNEFFDHNKISLINQYSKVDFASPLAAISIKCRSLGRLFDALAFLLANFKQLQSYEGQAALKLEHLAANAIEYEEFQVGKWSFSEGLWELQWQTFLIDLMLRHRQKHAEKDLAAIAAGFHHFLVDSFLSFAKQQGFKNIVLSGGVWQNRLLLRIICEKAGKVGIKVHLTPIMQVNDGAISLGQLFYKKIETRDSEK
nr:carbamoyltransferase HypF [Oligoflexales bacterium]